MGFFSLYLDEKTFTETRKLYIPKGAHNQRFFSHDFFLFQNIEFQDWWKRAGKYRKEDINILLGTCSLSCKFNYKSNINVSLVPL